LICMSSARNTAYLMLNKATILKDIRRLISEKEYHLRMLEEKKAKIAALKYKLNADDHPDLFSGKP